MGGDPREGGLGQKGICASIGGTFWCFWCFWAAWEFAHGHWYLYARVLFRVTVQQRGPRGMVGQRDNHLPTMTSPLGRQIVARTFRVQELHGVVLRLYEERELNGRGRYRNQSCQAPATTLGCPDDEDEGKHRPNQSVDRFLSACRIPS